MSTSQEKTEQPTQQKLKQARKKGKVAKSQDFSSFFAVLFGSLGVLFFAPFATERILWIMHFCFENAAHIGRERKFLLIIKESLNTWGLYSFPIAFSVTLGAIIGNIFQVGFLFSLHPLKMDLKKINPISGLKNIISWQKLIELLKNLLKFILLGFVFFIISKEIFPFTALFLDADLNYSLYFIILAIKKYFFYFLLIFLFIGIFDFFWQRYFFLKQMRMSKEEIKKEYKEQEGDAELKHERKRINEEYLENASIQDVKLASVILTNPSHIAVAIRYNEDERDEPFIVAKGIGSKAKMIMKEADRLDIMRIRNVKLTRELNWLNINDSIPEHLFMAVAEVLTFIRDLKQEKK